ncbi:MAG: hypothetical protein FJ398_02520 [Verrucomicrobia bacterium]|nr:hypothetical protein [Verrucomicrobiota bacterium]
MKTLVCISNYGDGQLLYLHQILIAYDNMSGFEVDVVLHTTVPLDLSRYAFRATQIPCDPAMGRDLALCHRKVMDEAQDQYDLFIYTENDVLIAEDNLRAFCETNAVLPEPYVAGFIRYERNRERPDDPEMYLPDAHPSGGRVLKGQLVLNGLRCARLRNLHQGCSVLTRAQLKCAMKSPFYHYYNRGDPLNREVGASFVYIGCGLQKVIPIDRLEELMIHHLSDKYVHLDEPPWNKTPPYTLTELKRFIADSEKRTAA